MADRRRAPGPNSLVASARILREAKRGAIAKPTDWQQEAWGYYDSIGEVRFACSWYANALSRVRLTMAVRGKAGEEPVPLPPDDPRQAFIEDLAGGETGQSQLLASFAPHLVVPGIAYLVGVDDPGDGARSWRVLSFDEIAVKAEKFAIATGPSSWEPLPDDSLPVQVWRPHARYHYQADSPLRPLLPVLRELSLLSQHVDATATSRLAGAGVFAIPSEATFPISPENADKPDPFLAEFMDAMLTPIQDRDAASAMVPLLMRIPGEHLEKLQHITFSTPFDDKALSLREEAIRRYANGMDMPAEVLLGLGDSNHWTAWQIEEGAIKLHIVPMVETICQALTTGWWRPLSGASAALGQTINGADDLIVWYDVSGLAVRPDRSGDARELYQMKLVGAKAVLREANFSEDDAPTDDELKRAVLFDVVTSAPSLAPIILPLLGIELVIPADAAPLPTTPAQAELPAGEPAAPADGPPDPPEDAPEGAADEASIQASAVAEAGLLAACDEIVLRAMVRAGNRLDSASRRASSTDLSGYASELRHLHADASCLSDFDRLLEGAWDRVPLVADRYGYEPAAVTSVLEGYTRTLLAARLEHSFDLLAGAFG